MFPDGDFDVDCVDDVEMSDPSTHVPPIDPPVEVTTTDKAVEKDGETKKRGFCSTLGFVAKVLLALASGAAMQTLDLVTDIRGGFHHLGFIIRLKKVLKCFQNLI